MAANPRIVVLTVIAVLVAAVTALTLIISACLITDDMEKAATPPLKVKNDVKKMMNGRIYPP
ncbi:hypothetical protein D3C84_897510 [compost metagenome]